jgi:TolB-like protein
MIANSQTRIAVLPFQNMDGDLTLNLWCYELQDSLTNALLAQDPEENFYRVVPSDSVETLLTEFNIDPNNPQYQSDVWKTIKLLNVKKVVTGNFNIQYNNILINAYIYNVRTRMADPEFQARDIFLEKPDYMKSINIILPQLVPGLKK